MKSERAIIFGCTHFPLHDERAIDWLLETICREKPNHLFFIGDALEANAASKWDDAKELAIGLGDEFDALNTFLASVKRASPNSRKRFLAGNHEANISAAGRLDPRIRSLCDWRKIDGLREWEVKAEYGYKRDCSFRLGQVVVGHGVETSEGGVETEAMYHTLHRPFGLFVAAHTHRPQQVREIRWKGLPMKRWVANVGCLRGLEPGFMERKRKWEWGHACGIVDALPINGVRLAKEWEARVEILRMFDDELEEAA
jgi:hypothetical protein